MDYEWPHSRLCLYAKVPTIVSTVSAGHVRAIACTSVFVRRCVNINAEVCSALYAYSGANAARATRSPCDGVLPFEGPCQGEVLQCVGAHRDGGEEDGEEDLEKITDIEARRSAPDIWKRESSGPVASMYSNGKGAAVGTWTRGSWRSREGANEAMKDVVHMKRTRGDHSKQELMDAHITLDISSIRYYRCKLNISPPQIQEADLDKLEFLDTTKSTRESSVVWVVKLRSGSEVIVWGLY
ncbi:hypothetical protein DFH07DRAFT_773117 [Mycena maculata]|uniref:Uncharacterized protein n=1 Tax=Mycena maculata TaxID=230809 RepID=A0AAD7J614_9AGAR|nr:hypothetical protein DFH07DRAFT_773117 [Mycena maculata]